MGYDLWNHSKFLQHKVRNMTRRGWLLKVDNQEKMLRGRVKMGEHIENDGLDIIQPVCLNAHVKPSEKTEILTLDPGGDTSRRVILSIFGDREQHPQPDEGEVFLYAPGEKKQFVRMKKKREGGGQGRADGEDKDSSGNKDSGRETGFHWDALEERFTGTTQASGNVHAEKGQGYSTKDGNFDIKTGGNTQMKAAKHIRKGETHDNGEHYVEGSIHVGNVYADGGTDIEEPQSEGRAGATEDRPDGTKTWKATGRKGKVGLLETAAQIGNIQAIMALLQQGQNQQNQQNQQQQERNEQQDQTNDDLLERVRELEEQVRQLLGGP